MCFNFLPNLLHARKLENIKRKVPQFNRIRETMYEKNTPKVQLEIGYRRKVDDEVTIVHGNANPRSQYPPNEYEKFYEMASVKVILHI